MKLLRRPRLLMMLIGEDQMWLRNLYPKKLPTTAGSSILEGFISPYNATVYEKLKKKGAILIGKNTMDAWGHGGSSQNTDYKKARNPWDVHRVAGGSSGGSAVSVAARMV